VEITTTDCRTVTANSFNTKRFFSKNSDRVYVKFCGIKNELDANAAIECGADALGFNLHPGSARFIQWQREKAWIRGLPAEISRVAVVVNPALDEVLQLLEMDVFDGLQLHGDESMEFCESLVKHRKPVLKALRLKNVELLQRLGDYPVFGFLIDSHREGAFGGTGERFEWTLLKGADLNKPLVIAGGLTPENVTAAVRELSPYAVDVASGIENAEGCKDRKKMQDFVAAARRT
jgi:phosphoribosylanthranilate isomerase